LPYGVRFQVLEREIADARLANLSASGCALEVQMAEAWHLGMGSVLETFYLDHPDLPFVPLQASVVRILGKVAGKTQGYALVGVDFSRITDFVGGLIEDHVAASLAEAEP
jgi:c-di-GMP-binding flagellar brake protein YcgR